LRRADVSVVAGAASRSLRAQLRHANQLNARHALVIGTEELASGAVNVRDLETSEQESLPLDGAIERLQHRSLQGR
jgi:histidyl-tRNA synthetase